MKKRIVTIISVAIVLMLLPVSAYANMVWPSLYIAQGFRSWYIILIGLIVEIFFIKQFAKQSWPRSVLISAIMNAVSALAGIALIPISGIIGEFIMLPVDLVLKLGTFHITHWIMAYIMVVICNTVIEGLVVKLFKLPFKKSLPWLAAANAISVIVCAVQVGLVIY